MTRAELAAERGPARGTGLAEWSFDWLTDPHVLVSDAADQPVRHGILHVDESAWRVERFVDELERDRPDLVLCTGDAIDTQAAWRRYAARHREELERHWPALAAAVPVETPDEATVRREMDRSLVAFRAAWQRASRFAPTVLAPGNHDVMGLRDRAGLLRGTADRVADGPVAPAVTLPGDPAVAMVTIDTSHGGDALTWAFTGRIDPASVNRLEAELRRVRADTVLIAMHHGPHTHGHQDPHVDGDGVTQFHREDAERFAEAAHRVLASRTALRIYCLFGHEHGNDDIRQFDEFGPELPGYLAPCLVDHPQGRFVRGTIDRDGRLSLSCRRLPARCDDHDPTIEAGDDT